MNGDEMNKKTFIVAEISANHGGSLENAKASIKGALEAGADAVKIQTYTADTITINCNNEYFQIKKGTLWDGKTLYELYKEAFTPWEWHKPLFDYAKELGIPLFSTPFDFTAVDFLEELGNPYYKVASFEIVDIPLIEYMASKGKPIIISTGIATKSDIEDAVRACHRMNNFDVTLLQCTSEYPAKLEDANLAMMGDMKREFNVNIGLSDHTNGIEVPTIAVAMGATIVEKHFILDKSFGGPDSSFSMEPSEFKKMVEKIRQVEMVIGKVDYTLSEKRKKSREFSRSLFVVKDIEEGETFTHENIRSIRPSNGLAPKYLPEIIGKKALKKIEFGTPLAWEFIKE